MAYEPGSYSEELREEHGRNEHDPWPHGDFNCPACRAIETAMDDLDEPSNKELMDFAAGLDRVTEQHASHSPTNRPNKCLTCAAEVGQNLR